MSIRHGDGGDKTREEVVKDSLVIKNMEGVVGTGAVVSHTGDWCGQLLQWRSG